MDSKARAKGQVRRVQTYVKERFLEEIKGKPRGADAALARRVGITTAYVANLKKDANVAMEVLFQFAAYWRLTPAELVAEALGDEVSTAECRVHPMLAKVARERRYTAAEAEFATAMVTPEHCDRMRVDVAEELLRRSRQALSDGERFASEELRKPTSDVRPVAKRRRVRDERT